MAGREPSESGGAYKPPFGHPPDELAQLAHTHLKDYLLELRSTPGWRSIIVWQRFIRRLFPPETIRFHYYSLVINSLEVLFHWGVAVFLQQIRRWWRSSRHYTQISTLPPVKSAAYHRHILATEPSQHQLTEQTLNSQQWVIQPQFNLITALQGLSRSFLEEMVGSIQGQTYQNWTWHICFTDIDEPTRQYLHQQAQIDSRIQLILSPSPQSEDRQPGIVPMLNRALRQIQDGYVITLAQGDTLSAQALYLVAEAIHRNPEVDFIYSDTDYLDAAGYRCNPLFKPDWSPEMMLSYNILDHLGVYRAAWLKEIGYLDPEAEGVENWDLHLRIVEKTDRIYHLPQLLYHRRKVLLSQHSSAALQAKQQKILTAHLKRKGLIEPKVNFKGETGYPFSTWQIQNPPQISIIIPSCDQTELLTACLDSLFNLTTYPNYQVILVDTGSQEAATETLYKRYGQNPHFELLQYTHPFNFQKVCNFAAQQAEGQLLLFLNNDTEILQREWLQHLAQWFELKSIGAVGAKLLYPNRTIQHAGLIVGLEGFASHVFAGQPEGKATIFGTDDWYRNLLAVTGACLMVSRQAFEAVGGFDEKYQFSFGDVELCLRIHQTGYRIVYTPQVRLIHHQGATHDGQIPRSDFERASRRWLPWLLQGDPYFNPNLSYAQPKPIFRRYLDEGPYIRNLALMQRLPAREMITLPDDLL